MRPSVKRSLSGILMASALGFSVVGAHAFGNANGPDAFIGIVPAGPEHFQGGEDFQAGGFRAQSGDQFGHNYRNRHGGYGAHDGDYNRGY